MKIALLFKKIMIKGLINISFISLLFILISCSSIYIIGDDFNDFRVQEISIGSTNKNQILGMFGEPASKGMIDQNEVYSYSYEEYEFPAASSRKIKVDRKFKSLVVVFDESEIVKRFEYNLPSGTSLDVVLIDREIKKKLEEEESGNVNQ